MTETHGSGREQKTQTDVGRPRNLARESEATPSMAQFLEIKTANPDSLLWYRMGDFYELFFEDAVTASQVLGIVLTKRGKHLGQDIPMCGVPVVRADEYLQKLIRAGYRVAVCEQMEDPAEAKKRGSKAVVRRDVVRLVTPGTLTEDSLLDARARNYLTALCRAPGSQSSGGGERFALASLDISTGESETGEVEGADLAGELARLQPGEVIAVAEMFADGTVKRALGPTGAAQTGVPGVSFDSLHGERALKARLGVADLGAFGTFSRAELAAMGALLRYAELTQTGKAPLLRPPKRTGAGAGLMIDAASRANLELVRTTRGERAGSLLAAIDRTVTGAGARELAARLALPLTDPRAIADRLDAVEVLAAEHEIRARLRAALAAAPDIARALSRLTLARGSPRDLAALRDGLRAAAACAGLLGEISRHRALPAALGEVAQSLGAAPPGLTEALEAALVADPPQERRDGGFVRPGFHSDLDAQRKLRDESRSVLAALEAQYVAETGIKSLKIRHNNVLGYYIETTARDAKPLLAPPLSARFPHRQTLANAVRFTSAELAETEGRIATAAERALAIEQEIFANLAAEAAANGQVLTAMAAALAVLDHTQGLAELAVTEGYTRPLVDSSLAFDIEGGRHAAVEQALKAAGEGPFIENDCRLDAGVVPQTEGGPGAARLWLVTGPNMAGKSTFLRQNALIIVLAQMGSFVPARRARLGAVDRLFSRVGASDDLARGRSTFMVEMIETAAILNQAAERSFVILDEVGRGTSTFDGLSLAWAVAEHLYDTVRCRTLFATHYHELTALAGRCPHLANVTMEVTDWRDGIVFLHKVKPGTAARSYGIEVAKLAGLPGAVLERAGEILALLEKGGGHGTEVALAGLPLFAAIPPRRPPAPSIPVRPSPLEAAVETLDPDAMTPRQALEALYRLKELTKAQGN